MQLWCHVLPKLSAFIQSNRWPTLFSTPTTNMWSRWPKKRQSESNSSWKLLVALRLEASWSFFTVMTFLFRFGFAFFVASGIIIELSTCVCVQWLSPIRYQSKEGLHSVPTAGLQQGQERHRSGRTTQTWRHQPSFFYHVRNTHQSIRDPENTHSVQWARAS